MIDWPKDITTWFKGSTGLMSVPFTWLLPKAQGIVNQSQFGVDRWIVGGPACRLMPYYLRGVTVGDHMPGVLQRVNPMATRTTVGCPNRCEFCGIGQRKIEGEFRELDDWLDGNIICDDNLLAASNRHFDKVIERLRRFPDCDFNQGLDARLLTPHHARQLATLRKPTIRLALDSDGDREAWSDAVATLRAAGIAKWSIRSLVLCGFHDTPEADWSRCQFVQSHGIKASPMWFHRLDTMRYGTVTAEQERLGWTEAGRKRLMGWFYKHRGTPLVAAVVRAEVNKSVRLMTQ